MNVNRKNKRKKITSEKPISLSPLDFKEALTALLKIKPKLKEEVERPEEKLN